MSAIVRATFKIPCPPRPERAPERISCDKNALVRSESRHTRSMSAGPSRALSHSIPSYRRSPRRFRRHCASRARATAILSCVVVCTPDSAGTPAGCWTGVLPVGTPGSAVTPAGCWAVVLGAVTPDSAGTPAGCWTGVLPVGAPRSAGTSRSACAPRSVVSPAGCWAGAISSVESGLSTWTRRSIRSKSGALSFFQYFSTMSGEQVHMRFFAA